MSDEGLNILALDLGSKTGWAISIKGSRNLTSGTTKFLNSRFEGGGMRYLRLRRWLDDTLIVVGKIDCIYIEEVNRHLGIIAAHIYGGFLAIITEWCELNKIPYSGIPIQTIKKFITGKGNACKQEMIDGVKCLGYDPQDDNEADAISLMLYVLNLNNNGKNNEK